MIKKLLLGIAALAGFWFLIFKMMNRNHKETTAAMKAHKLKREQTLLKLDLKATEISSKIKKSKKKNLERVERKLKIQQAYVTHLQVNTNQILKTHEDKLKKLDASSSLKKRLIWLKNSKYTPSRFVKK